jgi:hypothetical protein
MPEESRRYLLHGPPSAVEIILKRVAVEWGGEIGNNIYAGGLPGLSLNRQGQRVHAMFLEELPHDRCQLRITAVTERDDESRLNNGIRRSEAVESFLEAATQELLYLGFMISDQSTPRIESSEATDERFSQAEQQEIRARLDALEATLLQQFELDREQVTWVHEELQLLRAEMATSNKITWRHLARSVLLGIASMIGGQGGKLFAEQALELVRPFLGRFPFLLGSGQP